MTNSVRWAISSQIAGTWCCQTPPPRKRERLLAGHVAGERPRRWRLSVGLRAQRRRQLDGPCARGRPPGSGRTAPRRRRRRPRRAARGADAGAEFAMYGWAVTRASSSRRDLHDDRPAGSGADADVAATARRRAPRRRCRRAATAGPGEQLVGGREHLDAVAADAAQHARAELLVAAPEERALAADDADARARRRRGRPAARAGRPRRGRGRRPAPSRTASTPSSVPCCPSASQHGRGRRARPEQRQLLLRRSSARRLGQRLQRRRRSRRTALRAIIRRGWRGTRTAP